MPKNKQDTSILAHPNMPVAHQDMPVVHDYDKVSPSILGTGMAAKAAMSLTEEARKKRECKAMGDC